MIFSLSPAALAQAYRLESYDIVDSTNNLAAEFAKSGDSGRLWIVAAEQTGGRGRRGRVWQSPRGNLYASLLLCADFEPEQAAMLGFVAGLALIEALAVLLPDKLQNEHSLLLKWPNDIIAGKAKLAGILPEFIALDPGGDKKGAKNAAIIGIGVNIGIAPAPAGKIALEEKARTAFPGKATKASIAAETMPLYPITSLQALGADCSPQNVFQALSRFWVENYALWNKGQGMAALRDKWLRYAAYRGEIMHLRYKGQVVSGVFKTIDEGGHLLLQRENGGELRISAGDVYFGTVASALA